ncbi:MAG: hypothetical protein KDD62_01270, partial [Bdellovibrionales bacterium]|nr:hypothetical protein [Bdellovibrionales bacterium]
MNIADTFELTHDQEPERQAAAAALKMLCEALADVEVSVLENGIKETLSDEQLSTLVNISKGKNLGDLKNYLSSVENNDFESILSDDTDFVALRTAAAQLISILESRQRLLTDETAEVDPGKLQESSDDFSIGQEEHGESVHLAQVELSAGVSFRELWPQGATYKFADRFTVVAKAHDEEELKGGQGSVHVVKDEFLGQYFVIKVLHPEKLGDSTAVERFMREGREGSKPSYLGTPLAPVNSFVDIAGVKELGYGGVEVGFGLVQARINGPEFKEVIQEHNRRKAAHLKDNTGLSSELKAERDALVNIWFKTLEVVGGLHESGDVHRDIKPENIRLSVKTEDPEASLAEVLKDAKPFVLDLGMIKPKDVFDAVVGGGGSDGANSELTQQGTVMGSVHYFSPEQVRDSAGVGSSTDLYACGCMLYELLTGKKAQFDGLPFPAIIPLLPDFAKNGTVRPRPREIDPTIDPILEAIVIKCLATKFPEKDTKKASKSIEGESKGLRYGDVKEIQADVENYRLNKGEEVKAYIELPSESFSEKARKLGYRASCWIKRHPKLSAAATAVTITGAMVGGFLFQNYRAAALALQTRLDEGRAAVVQRIGEGELNAAAADLLALSSTAEQNNLDEAQAEFTATREAIRVLPLIEEQYKEVGLSIIDPMRNSAVRPQSLIETEKLLAWVVANPQERTRTPAEYQVPDDWAENYDDKFLKVIEDAAYLSEDYKREITDQVGVLLFGVAADLGTPRLDISHTEEEIKTALELYDSIETLWGERSERAVAIGRKNAWSIAQDPKAGEKIAALEAALNGRLSQENADARSLLLDAMFALNSGL